MKITRLRIDGEKLSINNAMVITKAERELETLFNKHGFVAPNIDLTKKISGHMCQFKIDPAIRGYNVITYRDGKTKRTRTPTWSDRVEFNDLVNSIFDKYKLTAKITSGPFLVRDSVTGAKTEDDWFEQESTFEWYNQGFSSGQSFNGLGQCMQTLSKLEKVQS